jgi:polyhydroxyalkanoate synthase
MQYSQTTMKITQDFSKQIFDTSCNFWLGLHAFKNFKCMRHLKPVKTIWQDGSTRLFDYGNNHQNKAPIILFVPSLINKSYILDLTNELSLMRYLSKQGINCFLVDWGEPKESEYEYCLTDYISKKLQKIIDLLYEKYNQKIIIAGYCLGGMMTLATSIINSDKISSSIFLATPWDFYTEANTPYYLNMQQEYLDFMFKYLESWNLFPKEFLQLTFFMLDPFRIIEKFAEFFTLDKRTKKARRFAAVENWVNDGTSLTKSTAKDLIVKFNSENLAARNKWCIEDIIINPAKHKKPSLLIVPEKDKIVPPHSALALAEALPNKTIIRPDTGHVGMIVGSQAKKQVWEPIRNWVKQD